MRKRVLPPKVQNFVYWERAKVNADDAEVERHHCALGDRLVGRDQFAKSLNQLRPIRCWTQLYGAGSASSN